MIVLAGISTPSDDLTTIATAGLIVVEIVWLILAFIGRSRP